MKTSVKEKPIETKEVLEKETKIEECEESFLDEFKKEVLEQTKKNTGKIVVFSFLILVTFGLLGIATYQIFFKPEKTVQTKTANEKIEGRPEAKEEPKTEQPAVQTPAPQPQPTETSYSVQAGDTWSSIANANGMTSSDLMKYNNTTDENLQIGQTVKIPKTN